MERMMLSSSENRTHAGAGRKLIVKGAMRPRPYEMVSRFSGQRPRSNCRFTFRTATNVQDVTGTLTRLRQAASIVATLYPRIACEIRD